MSNNKTSLVSGILNGKATAREQVHSLYYYAEVAHEFGIDIQSREMWIHGEGTNAHDSSEIGEPGVEYNMATKVIKNLHILKRASRTEPITIHLHTCGGDVVEGLAIYDTIKMMPYKVTIISYTHARSMSSYILQAADERILLPHSYFMFHDGEMWTGGTVKQAKSYMDFTDVVEKQMADIYIDALKKKGKYKDHTRDQIARLLRKEMDKKEDVYLTAEEAIEWGFADKILTKF